MEPAIAALIGAAIGASASVCAIVGNVYVMRQTLRQGAVKDIAKLSIEHRIQQMNELYGPLLQLTAQNKQLADKLREGKANPQEWRLLDHLPEVLKDPRDGPLADAILSIDARIEDLIINKGGLVAGPQPPDSFEAFLSHYKLLKMAMEGKAVTGDRAEYYPRAFDEDVRRAYADLKSRVDKVLAKYEETLSEFTD